MLLRYGAEASKTTEEGFQVAVDLVQTTYNMKDVGVKKLAKKMVKETGKSYGKKRWFGVFFDRVSDG
jgi:hypothetical protein